MKKLLKLWPRLPVKLRACANAALICLCLLLIYIFLGSPPFTARQAFRRAEKAELVGPSQILSHVRPEGTPYRHLILADDEDGVILFAYDRWDPDATELLYIEKTGDLTIAAAPDDTFYPKENRAVIPIVLFHEGSRAVRAELDLTLSAHYEGEEHQKTYYLQSQQTFDGCFLFSIDVHSQTPLGAEGQLLFTLQTVTGNSMADTRDNVIPAVVRLYDQEDDLIREETILIRSAAALANAQ